MVAFQTAALAALLAAAPFASAVKHDDFKTCNQASFCRRLRSLSSRQHATPDIWTSPYSIVGHAAIQATGEDQDGDAPTIVFPVKSSLFADPSFELKVDVVGDGIARVRMDEVGGLRQRYDEAARWVLVDNALSRASFNINTDDRSTNVTYPSSQSDLGMLLSVQHNPLQVSLYRVGVDGNNGEPEVVLNGRGLLHMEHFRPHPSAESSASTPLEEQAGEEQGAQTVLGEGTQEIDRTWFEGPKDEWEKDMWEEKWKTWTDTKPKGPESLSIDISFPAAQTHLYGLPEHASPLSLPSTKGALAHYNEPYRLYNVDIFEYLADSPMAMYGAIPLVQAHSPSGSVGVLALHASETWVDVEKHAGHGNVDTQWISESGILDLFLLPGAPKNGPTALFKQYASLTGPSALPAHWALGYHQCRWNYLDQEDVLEVDRRFDEITAEEAASDVGGQGWPLDVTWLDIEYAEEHRYFDWDLGKFPDVKGMLAKIADKGRKMVAIVDPHIKRSPSFDVYAEAVDLDILVKRSGVPSAETGKREDYEGWCWTGSSAWVDFFLERSWDWWTSMFKFDKWTNSAANLFIWNDMNEPSVFNGPEISMPRDALHQDGKWEHRDIHNINGLMFAKQTALALVAREDPPKRPFVLSRSFYPGSQRWGAVWTGDNLGTWDHLKGSFPMILSNGVGGITFCGADVGGFFGNPTPEFLVRFYQAGVFMPFFRAHAHIDTKRREPYLLEEPYKSYVRDMLRLRYTLLPVWYTAFREAASDGVPVLRPQYVAFPDDDEGFAMDDQFYIGTSGLLVKPVVEEESEETDIYLSDNQPYYDYFTHHFYPSSAKPRTIPYAAPLSSVPVLHQGGSILPIRTRVRRASPLMWQDPYTLVISLGKDFTANGELYSDDGDSFGYEKGDFIWRGFSFGPSAASKGVSTLKSVDLTAARPKDMEGLVGTTDLTTHSPSTNSWAQKIAHVRVERIVVLGLKSAPRTVTVGGEEVEFEWQKGSDAASKREGQASELTLKNPPIKVVSDWEILFD